MDNEIRIRWSGGERTFAPGQTVVIGRDPGIEVEVSNATVSRRHAEVAFDGRGWVLRDLGSTQGTHVDHHRSDQVEVTGTTSVVLGDPRTGETVTLVVAANDSTTFNHAPDVPAPSGFPPPAPGTVLVGGGPERPGGHLQANQLGGATVVTGQTLNVECGGRTYSFEPGATVVIGRDESCDVTVANPTVSRRHATIQHDGTGWSITDAGSSSGTFIDERKVTTAALSGSTAVFLGGPDTGERMVVVTSGSTRRPSSTKKRRNLIALGAGLLAVAALVVALGAIVVATRGGPDDNQLARATVLIEVDGGAGSGSIIDAEEGLILTNAHVADPRAPGQALLYFKPAAEVEEAGELKILVSPSLDKAAEFKYIAEVVASDGYLDLAVLKITKTAAGALIEDGDLEGLTEVALGNSSDVESGTNVSVFGFPGIADSKAVSVTRGVVQGGVQDDRLGDNRAFFNVDAVVNPGNSGGLAADDSGKLIGVPTLGNLSDLDEAGRPVETIVSSIRPIDFAKPLIEEARTGKPAKSPSDLRTIKDESIDESSVDLAVLGSKPGIDFDECVVGEATEGDEAVAVVFDFDGFVDGENQDIAVLVQASNGDVIGLWQSKEEYPLRWPDSGCATVSLPLAGPIEGTALYVTIYLGPTYEEVAFVELPVSGA